MAEIPSYGCFLSAEAATFLLSLPRQRQKKVIDLVERIAAPPGLVSDYQTTESKDRPIENLLMEEFLFTYWIDQPSKEVQVTDILEV